jgi:hypothetical protein
MQPTTRPIACTVEIDGITYSVMDRITSGSRGAEYQLSRGDGLVHRVCHAPDRRVAAVRASGETIKYTWS